MNVGDLTFKINQVIYVIVAVFTLTTVYWKVQEDIKDGKAESTLQQAKIDQNKIYTEQIAKLSREFMEEKMDLINGRVDKKHTQALDFFKLELDKINSDQTNQWNEINKKAYK